ncbi:MAG: nitroreductase/quinone reductase family protein [Acidimicrobiia bacterium]
MDFRMATPPRWLLRIGWRLHRLVWDLTGGRLGRRVMGLSVLELVTTGHRSGQPRSILINYMPTPHGPALAGSNAGETHDPAWVKNLRAHPNARIRKDGRWLEVEARFLEGAEREQVWTGFVLHGDYAKYAKVAGRPIPIVLLEEP